MKDGSGAVWLTLCAGYDGDPSLRLKNGFAQDDRVVGNDETDSAFSRLDKFSGHFGAAFGSHAQAIPDDDGDQRK